MGQFISYAQCPCCGNAAIVKILSVKDFTVSNEYFDIWHCHNCTLRFTQKIPDITSIGLYYQSAAYVSHSDTHEGLVNRFYHFVRNYTLRLKRKLVQTITAKQKGIILDIGAGTGAFAHTMQSAGWKITGLEPDATARQNALQKYSLQLQTPETLYRLQSKQFDAITLWHVLEHVHDLHQYLETFHRILKDDGKLMIAVPNYTSYDATVYGEYWAAYDVPRHLYHFSPKSIEVLAGLKGFTVKGHVPMIFDSFYVSLLSEQYKNGKNNLISAFWNGLLSNLKMWGDKKKCSSVIYVLEKK